MRVDPAIAALRQDRGRQRGVQAAMAAACRAWQTEPEVADVLADMATFGDGAHLADCPALAAVFAGAERAHALVTTLSRRLCAALASEPLGHPPLRHGFDGSSATLLLARAGRAQLVLQAIEPGERHFASACYSDAERHELVLAGTARARVVRRRCFTVHPLALAPGVRLALDVSREALQVLAVEQRLVSLRLHRFAAAPGPSREYSLADGVLLHQSAGSRATSRSEIALALLGRMGRAEAAPAMAAIARAPGDRSLRWQALRECLALDSAEGFAALSAVANSAADPLARPAAALRAQLVEAYPELGRSGVAPCLA